MSTSTNGRAKPDGRAAAEPRTSATKERVPASTTELVPVTHGGTVHPVVVTRIDT